MLDFFKKDDPIKAVVLERRIGMCKNERLGRISDILPCKGGFMIVVDVKELCLDNNKESYNAPYALALEATKRDMIDSINHISIGEYVVVGYYVQSFLKKGVSKKEYLTKLKLRSLRRVDPDEADSIQEAIYKANLNYNELLNY